MTAKGQGPTKKSEKANPEKSPEKLKKTAVPKAEKPAKEAKPAAAKKKTAVKPESKTARPRKSVKTADKEHPETGGAPSIEEGKSALSAGTAAEQHPHFVAPDKAVSPEPHVDEHALKAVKKKVVRKPSVPAVENAVSAPVEQPKISVPVTPPVIKKELPPVNKGQQVSPVSAPAPAPVAPPQIPVPAAAAPAPSAPKPQIAINENVTVKELAEKMNLKVGDVLMRLLKMGLRASLNQRLDIETAILISSELGFDANFVPLYSEDVMLKSDIEDDKAVALPRPPVVTIMGHVDHGKTSLLDAIRQSTVAEKEAGGITQHIGAYKVMTEKGAIVFLDTPGHEAFTAMRARGAQATDLVVLVVAADDGVMPQTVEAIDHARAAGVTILVAVNKIDLPQAKPERVKQELSKYQLAPEEWGGKTIFVDVSAKKKLNIDKLLEMILLEAELLELKANPNRPAQGVVIEARLDSKKGPVATVIVQKGTLKVGDTFVCGLTFG